MSVYSLSHIVLCGVCAASHLHAAEDTLPPLTGGKAPQTFEELWSGYDPRKEPLETEILKEWEEDGVVLKVLRYRIGIFKGQKAMMAAVYGYPKGRIKLPGLVQIHGGGQYADYRAPLTNAKRGYATLSIAWAGRISAPGYSVNPDGVALFWAGKTNGPNYRLTTDWGALDAYHAPCRNAKNAFASLAPAPWTLDAVESPRNNPWFLCTLGARRALTFLEQQPEVNPEKLGVYGHSMGGKLTVMTTGADARVKASAPSCGGVSDRNTDSPLYNATIADNVYLARITCPIIFLSPANDFHGRINDLQKALGEIASKEWRVTCSPHHNHQDTEAYQVGGPLWFDQCLKGTLACPATPGSMLTLKTASGVPGFSVRPDASKTLLSVDVFYTQHGQLDGEKNDHENTMARFWRHAEAKQQGEVWTSELPLLTTDKPLWVYANVRYPLKEPVTGAGYYYGVYTAKAFTVSSRMAVATPAQLKAANVKATEQPSPVIETFENDWQKEWFTYDLTDNWARKTHKLYDPKWQAPPNSKLALEVRAEQANKLVVGLDNFAAEVALNGGPEWQSIAIGPADFHDAAGVALVAWKGIKELRLGDKETLRENKGGQEKKALLGAGWKGAKPEFRNLRWVQGIAAFVITNYGARAGEGGLSTSAIQSAIDACAAAGGGKVVIPAGRFVAGTIRMKDNVTLHLEEGAVLLGSTNLADYATDIIGAVEAPAFKRCLIYAHQAKNIGFSGKGLFDARGTPRAFPEKVGSGLGERPMLMRLVECERVSFKDVSFRNSASWGLHLLRCRELHFDGIRIDSHNNNPNNDGIDLDGCVNALVESCTINSGDDAVCLKSTTLQPCSNIVVRGCTVSSDTAAFKLGTSSRGGFRDITVTHCTFSNCPMGAVKLLLVDGGRLENVLVSDVKMDNVGGPLFIRLGNRGRTYDKPTEQVYAEGQAPEGAAVGVLRGVTIRNVEARVTGSQRDRLGIMITGIPGCRVEDVTLENLKVSFPGGGASADATRAVPEDVARYPEQFFFGVLPASCIYARHVKGLSLKNISLTLEKADARPPFYAEDVEDVDWADVTVNGKACSGLRNE